MGAEVGMPQVSRWLRDVVRAGNQALWPSVQTGSD